MAVSVPALSVDDDEALYFFCLVHTPPWPFAHDGLSGRGVKTVGVADGLTAVVDVVERDAWAGPQAEANMQSLEWVGARAALHEEVVEAAMAQGPVYPARFGTLYSSAQRLAETVDQHHEAIGTFMAYIDGADEWALKVFIDRDQAASSRAAAASDEKPTSGTAYLKQKQREQQARDAVDTWLQTVSDTLYTRLHDGIVRDVEVLDPNRAVLASPDETIALNWALLVPEEKQAALREHMRQFEARYTDAGLSFRLTGPWPAYTFRPLMQQDDAR